MIRLLLGMLVGLGIVAGAALAQGQALGQTASSAFSFVAIGDLPYGEREVVYPKYQSLIEAINAAKPDFTIHVGDFKSGTSVCSDDEFHHQFEFMSRFETALIYTPGDNEWTDCHRKNNGPFEPLERLKLIREMFFAEPQSLGQKPIKLERQSESMPRFKTPEGGGYVENARWMKNGVMFVTAHIVGSNNNFEPRDAKAIEEFHARDAANAAWIKDAFAKANQAGAIALALSIQADPFVLASPTTPFPNHSGFTTSLGETFVPLARDFAKPVLFVHGDSHIFRIDQPFKKSPTEVIENITRLEVFGEYQMHAVQVQVDPARGSDLWSFRPIFNPSGRAPQKTVAAK
jgi:hypothetical protein